MIVRSFLLLHLVVALSAALHAPVHAEPGPEFVFDLSLEELMNIPVSSVSFSETSQKKIPGAIWVFTQHNLQNYAVQNLADLVNMYVPGMNVGHHEFYGPLHASRGILTDSNAKTLVLLDGQDMNQRNHWGYMSGLSLPLLGDLRRVEVVNGPTAIVNGSGAINGVINLVPKNGTDNEGGFFNAEYGFVDELYKFEGGYGLNIAANHDLYLYGGIVTADGYGFDDDLGASQSPDAATRNSLALRRDGLKTNGFPEPSFKVGTYWNYERFKLNVLWQTINAHSNTIHFRQDLDSHWHQSILSVQPQYTVDVGDYGSWQLIPSMALFDYGIEGLEHPAITGKTVSSEGGSESHYEGKLVFTSRYFAQHSLALGGLFGRRYFSSGDHYLSSDPDALFFADMDGNRDEFALFAEDQYKFNDHLSFSLAIRYDRVRYNTLNSALLPTLGIPGEINVKAEDHISPQLSLAYQVNDQHNVKLSYRHGFHYPDAVFFLEWELFNTELERLGEQGQAIPKSETLENYELNYRYQNESGTLSVDTNLYYNTYRDILLFHDFTTAGRPYSQATIDAIVAKQGYFGEIINASGDFSSVGGEMTLRYYTPSHPQLHFQVSYAYSRPINTDTQANTILRLANDREDQWARYPTHQVKAHIEYEHGPWFLHLSGVYNSPVDTEPLESPRDVYNDPYVRFNTRVKYQFTEQLGLNILVNNLFANDVPPTNFITKKPWNGALGKDKRLVYMGLRWNW